MLTPLTRTLPLRTVTIPVMVVLVAAHRSGVHPAVDHLAHAAAVGTAVVLMRVLTRWEVARLRRYAPAVDGAVALVTLVLLAASGYWTAAALVAGALVLESRRLIPGFAGVPPLLRVCSGAVSMGVLLPLGAAALVSPAPGTLPFAVLAVTVPLAASGAGDLAVLERGQTGTPVAVAVVGLIGATVAAVAAAWGEPIGLELDRSLLVGAAPTVVAIFGWFILADPRGDQRWVRAARFSRAAALVHIGLSLIALALSAGVRV